MLNRIKVNKEINMKVVPLKLWLPSNILNSECKVKKILLQNNENRDGKNQKIIGKNNNPIIVLSQLSERLKILVEGSKIENKFIIIFNLKNKFFHLRGFFVLKKFYNT